MDWQDIIIQSITPIIIATIGFMSKNKWNGLINSINKINEQIDKVKEEVFVLTDYFNANKTLADYKDKLNEMNTYYISTFNNPIFKEAASAKGNAYLRAIEHIISIYDMDINDFNKIITELESGTKCVYKILFDILGEKLVDEYYEIHLDDYEQFKDNIECILSDTKNHYKERFVNEATAFLRKFMRHLKELEKKTCKH